MVKSGLEEKDGTNLRRSFQFGGPFPSLVSCPSHFLQCDKSWLPITLRGLLGWGGMEAVKHFLQDEIETVQTRLQTTLWAAGSQQEVKGHLCPGGRNALEVGTLGPKDQRKGRWKQSQIEATVGLGKSNPL